MRWKPTSTLAATSAIGARSASACTGSTDWTYDRWGNPDLVEPQYNNGEYFFKFSYDQLDNVHFPREGQTFDRCNGTPIAPIWAPILPSIE